MNIQFIEDLVKISHHVGYNPALIQGGGGNTSVKSDDQTMAIKASGFELKQLDQTTGFAFVNFSKIRNYFNTEKIPDKNSNQQCNTYIKENTLKIGDYPVLKPSIESGFHSLFKKYVIHTHSVYANLLCCSKEGKEISKKLFNNTEIPSSCWVSYYSPGFNITNGVRIAIEEFHVKFGYEPSIVFLQNHGVIVNHDDCDQCMKLSDNMDNTIREYFDVNDNYPEINIKCIDDGIFESKTTYLKNILNSEYFKPSIFQNVLYPDQIVYLYDNISFSGDENCKINIDQKKGKIVYRTNEREAWTIEETLVAYFYIMQKIKESELELVCLNDMEISYITNMKSEKFRQEMLKKI